MFNRSQGYKSVVKWFSLLAPQYTVETSTSGNCSQARTDLDECFRCTEKDIHANPPAQQMINARRNSTAGLQSVGCECIFRFCVILHFVQVYCCALWVKYRFCALLICTLQPLKRLHRLTCTTVMQSHLLCIGGGEGRAGLIYYSFEMENLTFVPQFLSLQPPPGNTLHILWTLDGVRLVEVEPSLQQVSC